jgi:hypothetical protein
VLKYIFFEKVKPKFQKNVEHLFYKNIYFPYEKFKICSDKTSDAKLWFCKQWLTWWLRLNKGILHMGLLDELIDGWMDGSILGCLMWCHQGACHLTGCKVPSKFFCFVLFFVLKYKLKFAIIFNQIKFKSNNKNTLENIFQILTWLFLETFFPNSTSMVTIGFMD